MSDVLVLCYHAVSAEWPAGLSVTPERLEAHLAGLLARGYRGATFRDAVLNPPATRTVAVTFDDAYRSVLDLAAPILRRLGIPGTVFVPTAFAGSEQAMAWPGIDQWGGGPYEDELVPMSWDELGRLADDGWEIGSHTRTHPRLPELDRDALHEELQNSRTECEARLSTPCTSLAYPFGDHDATVVEAARGAGYSAAGALAGRVRSPSALSWPRVGIYHGDGDLRFWLKASPALRRLRASRAWRIRFLLRGPRE
ncbi:MAG TPA: polysaccharide deacetylase family protein [Polyangia bacterium]|nr:polysaccharide deacetylase family protein [Polyangia bacterium]